MEKLSQVTLETADVREWEPNQEKKGHGRYNMVILVDLLVCGHIKINESFVEEAEGLLLSDGKLLKN